MSETETHLGKLRRIQCESPEKYAEEKMINSGPVPAYHKSYLSWMRDEYDDKYVSTATELYEIIEHKELDSDDDINELRENEDGTISFITRFYNGGACLEEMLQDALEEMKK